MRINLILLCLLVVATMAAAEDFNYCSLNALCKGGMHTMCLYPTDTPGEKCVKYEDHLLTVEEKQAMLKRHNRMRAQLQTGKMPGHPAAKVMPILLWSMEMEQLARRWALQCSYGHDTCRYSKNTTNNGQNIAYHGTSVFRGMHLEAVQDWFEEHKLFNATGENMVKVDFPNQISHYTQLVAAKTTHVGCERTFYLDKRYYNEYTVCVYHPAGNVPGTSVYDMLPRGEAGKMTPGPGPLPGETGVPEETILVSQDSIASRAPSVKQQNYITVLLVCLIFALKSAIFTEDF